MERGNENAICPDRQFRGVRLPKPIIEEAGQTEEVEVRVRDGTVVIGVAVRPRAGWAEAARLARQRGDENVVISCSSLTRGE